MTALSRLDDVRPGDERPQTAYLAPRWGGRRSTVGSRRLLSTSCVTTLGTLKHHLGQVSSPHGARQGRQGVEISAANSSRATASPAVRPTDRVTSVQRRPSEASVTGCAACSVVIAAPGPLNSHRKRPEIAAAETDEHLFILPALQEGRHNGHQEKRHSEKQPPAHDSLRTDQLHSSCPLQGRASTDTGEPFA